MLPAPLAVPTPPLRMLDEQHGWTEQDFELGADLLDAWLTCEISVVRLLERYRRERVFASARRAWQETTFADADTMRGGNHALLALVATGRCDIEVLDNVLAEAGRSFRLLDRKIWSYWQRHPEPPAHFVTPFGPVESLVLHLCRTRLGYAPDTLGEVHAWARAQRVRPPALVGLPLRSAAEEAREIDRALDSEVARTDTSELA